MGRFGASEMAPLPGKKGALFFSRAGAGLLKTL